MHLSTKLSLTASTLGAANLCSRFSEEDLATIGGAVVHGYGEDLKSCSRWKKRMQAALDLALQIQKDKNFPWPGCSNVAFPLVTIAALQWHAQAYSSLLPDNNPVRHRTLGADPAGETLLQAERVSEHMSWQVMEQDEDWEEQHDRMLIALPIVGTMFKKSYYSARLRHNVSEMVLPQDLVLNYYAKSLEACTRKTHVIPLTRNDLHERCVRGIYKDVLEDEWFQAGAPSAESDTQARVNVRTGMQAPQLDSTTPFTGLEQHVLLDLDDDGYAEPYIVTVEESSCTVLRIVTNFEEQDIERIGSRIASIRPIEYFTKYSFIPSPDGGLYDIGYGVLLGPLNESVNSIINQLIDCGTMANTAGGFLGRGMKIRGGNYTFAPLEWKRVDSSGEDISKNIIPLPVREPSQVMLALLSLLIDYTNRISSSTDAMVGESPGQNTPAETTRSVLEQGRKIYNAIFKRVWRCMKQEFRKLFLLNARYLPVESIFGNGELKRIYLIDYKGADSMIIPAADPNLTSDTSRAQQSTLVKQAAATTNGYDRDAVERHWLRSMKVDGWEALFKGSDKTEPLPNPKVMVEELKAKASEARTKAHMAEVAMQIQSDQEINKAKVDLLKAQAAKALEEAGGNRAAQKVKEFELQIKAGEAQTKALQGYLDLALKGIQQDDKQAGVSGMAGSSGHKGTGGVASAQNPGG